MSVFCAPMLLFLKVDIEKDVVDSPCDPTDGSFDSILRASPDSFDDSSIDHIVNQNALVISDKQCAHSNYDAPIHIQGK